MSTATTPGTVAVWRSRRALAGFLVSGLLLAFPGAVLPAWGYHLRPHYAMAGHYFLAVNAGVLASTWLARYLLRKGSLGTGLMLACAGAALSLASFAFTAPPVDELWRLPGLIGIGGSAGLLNTYMFHAISGGYRHDPASAVNLAGTLFGLGSLLSPLLMAGAFAFASSPWLFLLFAAIPAAFLPLFSRIETRPDLAGHQRRPIAAVARELRVPSALLFSALLFFQFGNEWAIAGWLPLFLIQRLGISPGAALSILALYWLALIVGRLVTQGMLTRVSHTRMLFGGALAALLGCVILAFTNNLFGAYTGTLLVGLGFAPIYPLAVEKIGARFPHYHPGFFNGIFSLALTGGMLAPATLGYAGERWGVGIVVLLPACGTFLVLLLVLGIWAEAKVRELLAKPHNHRVS